MDANGDGVADPYNPVDAIFTAARYLQAAGASENLSQAIFAYNHADWYVQSVLLRAKLIGGIPSQLIGALTGLVEGDFPVAAPAKYADSSVVSLAKHKVKGANAAEAIDSNPASKGTSIFAKRGSAVIAVNDGKIVKVGQNATLGRYVELQDATGNIYTYSELGKVSKTYAVPDPVKITARDIAAGLIDRRVLATIEFLSASGLDPYVSGLECGHSLTGSTGTDAAGATGSSVDISKINNIPVLGHQGPGSITDVAIRRLLTLQGSMRPDEIISTIAYKGQSNTLALPDHKNRIQITFTPDYGTNKKLSKQVKSLLQPGQWVQLINRISQIPEPVVPIAPSTYAIRTSSGRATP